MSAINCVCGAPAKTMGLIDCPGNLDRAVKLIFTAPSDSTGVKNSILVSDTVDSDYVTGMVNKGDKTNTPGADDDPSKRWFPTPPMKQVANVRADSNFQEIDGFQIKSSQGVRTMTFVVVEGSSPQLYEAFDSRSCLIDSFYTASVSNQIGGNGRDATQLFPFRIETGTLDTIYQQEQKGEETVRMIQVTFAFSELENDKDIAYFEEGGNTLATGTSIKEIEGIPEVTLGDATSITTAGFTFTASYVFGEQGNKRPWKGGVLADFTGEEISPTPAPEPIASITETSDGVYDLVWTTPTTSADLQRLTLDKLGFYAANTIDALTP